MKKLGQHFLTDKNALKKIAALLDTFDKLSVNPEHSRRIDLSAQGGSLHVRQAGASGGKDGDTVYGEPCRTIIEIGPGHGELTEQILNNELGIKNNGIRIVAIEKDEYLAESLRKKFESSDNVEIICGDALKLLSSIINNSLFIIRGYKLAGNIPYYITGKLLRIISELARKPVISVFTIQKEVAERLAAKPPRMNRLAASVQFWANPEIAMLIPRNSFRPIPEVDSATIVLKTRNPLPLGGTSFKKGGINSPFSKGSTRRGRDFAERYYKTVRVIFAQPRKTILNNLSDGVGISKREATEKLEKIGIETSLRPQNLSVEDIIKIASVF